MKVRVRKKPGYDTYYVETKRWYQFTWQYEDDFYGIGALERAMGVANEFMHLKITEIKKET